MGTFVEQSDTKINETAANITESLHDIQSNVIEEIEPIVAAVKDEVAIDDSKLRKRRSADSMEASTGAPRMSDGEMQERYNRLADKYKAMVDDIVTTCDGSITLDNICDEFGWDDFIGKLGPPPPMGPPLCESCGKEPEPETTIEPEETTAPVESTTTTVATTTTTVPTTTPTTTTEEDVEPTSPATHETVTVTEPCDPSDICDPCNDSFDIPPPPIPPMYPGANCTEKPDECATTSQPTTTEPVTETEPATDPPDPQTTDPPTTQPQTTECPEEDFCCEDDMFPPAIIPPPQLQCKRQVSNFQLSARSS